MTQKFTLKKHERLKSKKQIERLFKSSDSLLAHPIKLLYLKEELDDDSWPVKFSVSVPKRKVASAVKRNLIKRKIREAYRLNKLPLQEQVIKSNQKLSLMFIFIESEPTDFVTIEKSIIKILSKLSTKMLA